MTAGAFILSGLLTAIIRPLAIRAGFVARPSKDRYHQTVIPLGGGIAIYTVIALAISASMIIVNFLLAPGHLKIFGESANEYITGFMRKSNQLTVILFCVSILFLLGLIDDKKHLGPFIKLVMQFAVAIIAALFADIRFGFFIHNQIVTSLMSAVWIVLLINVFNFLDNMDGASAGIAAIVSA